MATTIYEFTKNRDELKEINKLLILWTESKSGESFLEMEDNFSLYVKIAESAGNSLPKDQINSSVFSEFIVEAGLYLKMSIFITFKLIFLTIIDIVFFHLFLNF